MTCGLTICGGRGDEMLGDVEEVVEILQNGVFVLWRMEQDGAGPLRLGQFDLIDYLNEKGSEGIIQIQPENDGEVEGDLEIFRSALGLFAERVKEAESNPSAPRELFFRLNVYDLDRLDEGDEDMDREALRRLCEEAYKELTADSSLWLMCIEDGDMELLERVRTR